MKTYKDFLETVLEEKKCPPGMKYDKKLKQCVPIRYKSRIRYFLGVPKNNSGDTDSSDDSGNGNGNGNGIGNGNVNGNGGNGNGGGESYLAADVRKMPDGGYGVYADKFKNKKRVMTPGGKHAKELKKVYKNKKDANDYMAAIMIAKGGG